MSASAGGGGGGGGGPPGAVGDPATIEAAAILSSAPAAGQGPRTNGQASSYLGIAGNTLLSVSHDVGLTSLFNWIGWSISHPIEAAGMVQARAAADHTIEQLAKAALTYTESDLNTELKNSRDEKLKRLAGKVYAAGLAAHKMAIKLLRLFLSYRTEYARTPRTAGEKVRLPAHTTSLVCALIQFDRLDKEKNRLKLIAKGASVSAAESNSQVTNWRGIKVETMPWQLSDLLKAFVQSLDEGDPGYGLLTVAPGIREQAIPPFVDDEDPAAKAAADAFFEANCEGVITRPSNTDVLPPDYLYRVGATDGSLPPPRDVRDILRIRSPAELKRLNGWPGPDDPRNRSRQRRLQLEDKGGGYRKTRRNKNKRKTRSKNRKSKNKTRPRSRSSRG
jgi:hypothetical protein